MRDEEREGSDPLWLEEVRSEVGLIIQPHGYVLALVKIRPNGVLQCLPVETFVKMIERLIEPALLRASSAEGPGLSPWGPIAAGWLRELDCIAERDC